ncbi:MAG: CDP-glycerol glycerophosphotransferase family protein, partial [Candidatus Saganbacteria bacterium]|nr:CDP-glycerol glycerophosphotransferase family protein [Candidatus Saganbacteria bacterium]
VDVFISPSIFGKGPHNAYNIHVAHNLPLLMKMESYPRNLLLNYNVQFFSGPLQRAQYDHMFKKNQIASASIRLCDIGYPKLDALLQGEYKRLDVLHELGLDAKKPTVLYAPAWDPGASLRSFGEAVIEKLTSLDGVNVIVKLHPVTYTLKKNPNFDFYTGGVDWVERLSRFEKYPNFRHVVDYKIDPLLAASDVMVTDISSVALEFILLDKPVIYLDCPEYFEKTIKQFGWNNDPNYILNNPDAKAMRNAGLCISDLSELVNAVQECIDHPEKKSEKRTAFSRRILYNPGRGAETAAKTVLELLRLE